MEEQLVVSGGQPLCGTVQIQGAKNGALPLLAASLLCEGESSLGNVPNLTDIHIMSDLLREVGVNVEKRGPTTLAFEVVDESQSTAPFELVSKMRASVYLLGPLLAKRGFARVSLPGGCVLGLRPVDLHVKGMRALGAEVELDHGYIVAKAPGGRLPGGEVFLSGPNGTSVGATANTLMAATLAEGTSVIDGAAREPEINELAEYLNAMGARIEGIGTSRLVIHGVERLRGCRWNVIPDRIEAGTYMMAAALTGGDVRVEGINLSHLSVVVDVLRQAGVQIDDLGEGAARVRREGKLKPVQVTTLPYPGYPTDLQAPLVTLLTQAEGSSMICEKIYPERFMLLAELTRMGAAVHKEGSSGLIHGVTQLKGADVTATDLRAGAALVMAGLVAEGQTRVHDVFHVDRGYANMERKLTNLGATIHREMISASWRRAA